MTLFISHTTAAECWLSGRFDALLGGTSISKRHRPAGSIDVERVAAMLAMDRLSITYAEALPFSEAPLRSEAGKPNAQAVRAAKTSALAFASEPTHVLVPSKTLATSIRPVACHVCTAPLPHGSFMRASDGLLLYSPELCFLQMATLLPFLELVRLGFELCALYTLQPDGQAGYGRPLPPTTVRALSSYLEHRPTAPGAAAARKALRFVAVASGSPMETALAMILCLPPRLGGYGLPLPFMNYRIDAPCEKGFGKSYYLCDLSWPDAGICIEYDSDQEHTGSSRIAQDAQRRNDLTALGVTTITATREQVMDGERLDRIAHQLARALGVRIRDDRGWSPRERERLFRSLLASGNAEASWTKTRRFFIPPEG